MQPPLSFPDDDPELPPPEPPLLLGAAQEVWDTPPVLTPTPSLTLRKSWAAEPVTVQLTEQLFPLAETEQFEAPASGSPPKRYEPPHEHASPASPQHCPVLDDEHATASAKTPRAETTATRNPGLFNGRPPKDRTDETTMG
jgi:hypothetical protein